MNESIKNRIERLREQMVADGVEAYLVNGCDPHLSEYIPARWATREWLSGFSGSYGWMAITLKEAVLWTDSRYYLQATQELAGSGIDMLKARLPETIPLEVWVAARLKPGQTVGFDASCHSVAEVEQFSALFISEGIAMNDQLDLIGKIWNDRPERPSSKVNDHPAIYAGIGRKEKMDLMIAEIERMNADYQVVCTLDDLAWAFNIRGADVEFNPVALGYGLVGREGCVLFANRSCLDSELLDQLKTDNIDVLDYDEFFPYLSGLSGKNILIDPARTNWAIREILAPRNILVSGMSVPCKLKAIKNKVEAEGFYKANLYDGLALLDFQLWIEENLGSCTITEYDVVEKLDEVRRSQPGYMGPAFYPIVGYREHGAVVHLHVKKDNALEIKPEGILLFDSGGQYRYGTTDITRTIALGPVTEQMKYDFTLMLKGNIALSDVQFPYGTIGCHLDVLARHALWQHGLNYGHGTAHGIGSFLNVHEGPFSIRPDLNNQLILPGMVMSNEPGFYREGEYGVRVENMIHCTEGPVTPFGRFLKFDVMTLYPIETRLIDLTLLTRHEIDWINNYHQKIWLKMSPLANKNQIRLLKRLTVPL